MRHNLATAAEGHLLHWSRWIVFFVIASLAISQVQDNDTYTHLSLGRAILEHQGFPQFELFTYPSDERPFSYSAWLFGLGIYLLYQLGGGAVLSLLKLALMLMLIWVVMRDSTPPGRQIGWIALSVSMVTFLLIQERYSLRPELLAVLLFALSVWLLNRYWYLGEKRVLFWLPPLACLWANVHSSIALGFLVFGAFLLGGAIQALFHRRLAFIEPASWAQLRPIVIVGVLSFLASLVSPYGISQYLHAIQFHEILWYQQEIFELQPLSGTERSLYLLFVALVAGSFLASWQRFSIVHLLLVLPVLLMPLEANRYVIFAAVAAAPVMARNFTWRQHGAIRLGRYVGVVSTQFLTLGLIILITGLLPNPYQRTAPWGIGIKQHHPMKGVTDYLIGNELFGRVLNGFNDGPYLIWRGYPRLTVFVDSRGYVNKELLEDAGKFLFSSETTERLFQDYGFEIVIAPLPWARDPSDVTERYRGIDRSKWALVHWDDYRLTFLRRAGRFAGFVEENEFRYVVPDQGMARFVRSLVQRGDGKELGYVERELRRSHRQSGADYSLLLLSLIYNATHRYQETVALLGNVEIRSSDGADERHRRALLNEILGDAHAGLGQIALARKLYKTAVAEAANATRYQKLARSYRAEGDLSRSAEYLERAVDLKPDHPGIYAELANVYRELGDGGRADSNRAVYERLINERAIREMYNRAAKALLDKDYAAAEALFSRLMDVAPDGRTAVKLGFLYLETGRTARADEMFKRALALNEDAHEAYFGLARLAERLGDRETQARYLRHFLAVAPDGELQRIALQTLERLQRYGH